MRFDFTDLRLFLHVIEAQSITGGADRAGLALASASARIRGMEETSGVALLNRGARGVTPTPAGDALEHHARIVLAQMEQMRGDLQLFASGLRGQVRVLSGTSAMAHLPDALLRYLADYPAIDIKLDERQSFEIVEAVAAGVVDLGIAADTADTGSLETRPFAVDRLVLLVPIGHPFADRRRLRLRDVLDEPFVGLPEDSPLRSHLETHAAREGRAFKLRVRLSKFEAICAMVANGVGLAIVPEVFAHKHGDPTAVNIIRLSDSWALRHLLICARSFATLPVHARKLVEYLERDESGDIELESVP